MKRSTRVAALLIAVCFASFSVTAMDIAGNLTGVSYWRTPRFKNAMLSAQQWMPAKWIIANAEKWNNGDPDVVLDLDPVHGYPTQLPTQAGYEGERYWRSLTMEGIYIESYPFGTFTLLFEGTGEVRLERLVSHTVTGNGGTTSYEFDVTRNNAKTFQANQNQNPCVRGISVYITRSEKSDPIRNIRLIIPDANGQTSYVNDFEKQPFRPEWLKDLLVFKSIRFMNWVNVNRNRDSLWTERVQRGAPFQGTRAPHVYSDNNNNALINPVREVAYEYMIELCNIIQRDMWINIPCNANDDYIRNLAQLIDDHLEPHLNCYVEWGNEVWNGIFVGLGYQQALGTKMGLDNSNFAYTYMTGKIDNIFKDVFDNPNRVRSILSGQKSTPFILKKRVEGLGIAKANPWGFKPYAVAETAYFGLNGLTMEDKALYDEFNKAAVAAGNVKRLAYEGGAGKGKGPAMYDLYKNTLKDLEAYFDTFNQFTVFGRWDVNGNWGSKEYVGQTEAQAPKFRALKEYSITHGQVTQAAIDAFDFDEHANPIIDGASPVAPPHRVYRTGALQAPGILVRQKGSRLVVTGVFSDGLQMLNGKGQIVNTVFAKHTGGGLSIDISSLAAGMYHLRDRQSGAIVSVPIQ